MRIELFSSACVLTLEFVGTIKANVEMSKLLGSWMFKLSNDISHTWMLNRMKAKNLLTCVTII